MAKHEREEDDDLGSFVKRIHISRPPAEYRIRRDIEEVKHMFPQIEIVEPSSSNPLRTLLRIPNFSSGKFSNLEFRFPRHYPHFPPTIFSRTKESNININEFGEVLLELLDPSQWVPTKSMSDILLEITQTMEDSDCVDIVEEKDEVDLDIEN